MVCTAGKRQQKNTGMQAEAMQTRRWRISDQENAIAQISRFVRRQGRRMGLQREICTLWQRTVHHQAARNGYSGLRRNQFNMTVRCKMGGFYFEELYR